MPKLKLNPEPTFKAKVGIPVPGTRPVDVVFTFKHRTRDVLMEWVETSSNDTDVQSIMDCATGWELDDEFNAENVDRLCNNYPGAGFAIVRTYLDESRGARAKN